MGPGVYINLTKKHAVTLLITLLLFEIIFAVVFLAGPVLGLPDYLIRLFDLDGEANIPAWFSSTQLFVVGALFLLSPNWHKASQLANPWFLLLVGLGFVFLSLDESAVIHERVTKALKDNEWAPRFKGGHGIWISIYFSFATLIVLVGVRTILSFFKVYPIQSVILAAGLACFLIGGVGMEVLSYWYLRTAENAQLYSIEVVIEEFLEMAGISTILYGSLLCAMREPTPLSDHAMKKQYIENTALVTK
ncbi:hypothetical protein MKJ04_19565 [Pontibacter sp. E15-1]|uniref:hypothetical protein n=1 Tax=Pontibacter sp. E15-1 TaxID=2919918 RepID=UPI001F50107C|nr:hypothetical protein [Pontibacter sp. E15-1]MCJ8167050.1 hypothetical protein [Pontibacter sp. E15-1]